MTCYRSKLSSGLIIFLVLILGSISAAMFLGRIWAGLAVIFVVSAFIIHLFSSTRYIIDKDQLMIKSGFTPNIIVKISTITKISSTNDISSAPATSLDRIEIRYNQSDRAVISPARKIVFITHLTTLNPGISVNTG